MFERQAECFYCNYVGFLEEFVFECYTCPYCFSDNWEEIDVDIYVDKDDELVSEIYNDIE